MEGIASVLRGDFGHLLIHRDGVAFRRADLSAGQPDVDAVVVVPEASRMMQTADRSDDLAVLLQRLKRPGKLVILTQRRDLIVQRVDARWRGR